MAQSHARSFGRQGKQHTQRVCERTALQVASICRLAQPREGAAIRLPRKALRTDGSSTAGLAPQVGTCVALELDQVAGRADRQVAMAADMLSRGCCDENALGHRCPDARARVWACLCPKAATAGYPEIGA